MRFFCSLAFGSWFFYSSNLSIKAAGFVPVPVSGFSVDMIVEASARPSGLSGYTTASMEKGTNNTGLTFYEIGYNPSAPDTGLPPAGSNITMNVSGVDHTFRMAPSYATNNAIFVQTNATATLNVTFASPGTYASLSFLCAGTPGPVTNRVVIQHTVNTDNEVKNIGIPDWYTNNAGPFFANGAINLDNRAFTNVYAGAYSLYTVDVAVSTASPINNLTVTWFTKGAPTSHSAIFAVSGATNVGGAYSPITLTQSSYNKDLVIESNAPPAVGAAPCNASMDGGIANSQDTWYERGFVPASPNTGLPVAGSSFTTNLNGVSYQYSMASSYLTNDAITIDITTPHANLVPIAPRAYSGLSFLTSSGNAQAGPNLISVTTYYQDGTTEVNSISSPDWFSPSNNCAFIASGRVTVADLTANNVGTVNPRLFAADIVLQNTTSPVTNIDFDLASGTGHSGILAVSGIPANIVTVPPFRITGEQKLSSTEFKLTWESVAGQNYQVQSKDSLSTNIWRTNATVPAIGPSTSYTDSTIFTVSPRFYRVVATP